MLRVGVITLTFWASFKRYHILSPVYRNVNAGNYIPTRSQQILQCFQREQIKRTKNQHIEFLLMSPTLGFVSAVI